MPGAEREADQPADRLDVGHQRAARLAEAHEHLERLAPVVLGDRDVQRAERRLDPAGGAAEQLGPGPLLPALQVLRLELVHDSAGAARSRRAARRARRAGRRWRAALPPVAESVPRLGGAGWPSPAPAPSWPWRRSRAPACRGCRRGTPSRPCSRAGRPGGRSPRRTRPWRRSRSCTVLEIAESLYSWNAACIRTCHSGLIWLAVTNTRCHFSGTSGKSMCPVSAIRRIRSSEYQPSRLAIATKSSFTSGISTPAWFRMNATAKSGSMPELQPAMIEMVPVGATVVTLQLRSRRIGRIRSPLGAAGAGGVRAPDAPLPLGEDAAERRRAAPTPTLASSSTNCWIFRPSSTPSSES